MTCLAGYHSRYIRRHKYSPTDTVMSIHMERYPGFAPSIDTIYEYEHEGDLMPSRILHVPAEKKKSPGKMCENDA